MKKNEIKLTKKELLLKFLRANKAYVRFKNNVMKSISYKNYIKNGNKIGFINYYNRNTNGTMGIANAFNWDNSNQGFKFWNDLNIEFIYYSRDYYNGK